MKSLILKNDSNNFPILIVHSSRNSFGDQLLEFVFEFKNGSKRREYASFQEGHCVNFDEKTMLKVWESIT